MDKEEIIQTWPTSTAPYIPAPAVASNDVNDKEKTGVEGVKYDTVANAGAPVNPATPQAALNQALSPATTKDGATDGYSGSGLSDLIEYLEGKVREFKPLSKEEVEKLRKKQRAEGILSGISDAVQSIANLAATHNYAPNMYNPKEGMSARAQARFDKAKAQRDADEERYLNYALQLGKLREAQRAYDDGRKDRAEEIDFRNKSFDERVRQWQAGFDRDAKWHDEESQRWERQFSESVNQFNISSANERARISMEGQRLAQSLKEGRMTFNLGSGNGNVTLGMDKLNAQTVSRIYSTLPVSIRATVQGEPIVQNGFVVGYKPPTTEAMLIAIGANVESSPETQSAIKQVAGLEKGDKGKITIDGF